MSGTIITTSGTTSTAWATSGSPIYISGDVVGQVRKKRKARKPRPVPIFTINLEERLTKALGNPVKRIAKSLEKRLKVQPTIDINFSGRQFTFSASIAYQEMIPITLVDYSNADSLAPPMPKRVNKHLTIKLLVDNDNNLIDYEFSLRGK